MKQQGQLEVEEDVCNTMDEASNGYDHDPSSRETTGDSIIIVLSFH
jgi:hypothetical protein